LKLFFVGTALFASLLTQAMDEPILKEHDALKLIVSDEKKDDEPKPDKSMYNLFNPTPIALMRDMSTDRPDQTESTHTLDAGHFQFETTLLGFTFDERNPERVKRRVKSYEFCSTNYKIGLFNDIDFHVIIPSFTLERTTEKGHTAIVQGFGDITLRSKINLLNNDSDGPSVALLPFLKLPTNQGGLGNKSVEGGLIVPWSAELPKGWTTSGQFEIDAARNESNRGYHVEYGGTYEFSHKLISKLSGFWEFSAKASTQHDSRWVGSFNTGCTWELTKNIRLDGGINFGLTRSADDVKTFVGVSVRF